MPLETPKKWWLPFNKEERIWLGLIVVCGLIMFVMMPLGHLWNQNISSETYRTSPTEYSQVVNKFIQTYQRKDAAGKPEFRKGIPVVNAPDKDHGDSFIVAGGWQFRPILVLKKGKTYRIHMSSLDFQHGFSLQPQNLNFQILPDYDFVITLQPTETGTFQIVCNEFCGLGHDGMNGLIIVE